MSCVLCKIVIPQYLPGITVKFCEDCAAKDFHLRYCVICGTETKDSDLGMRCMDGRGQILPGHWAKQSDFYSHVTCDKKSERCHF